jgi:hypothetical protein
MLGIKEMPQNAGKEHIKQQAFGKQEIEPPLRTRENQHQNVSPMHYHNIPIPPRQGKDCRHNCTITKMSRETNTANPFQPPEEKMKTSSEKERVVPGEERESLPIQACPSSTALWLYRVGMEFYQGIGSGSACGSEMERRTGHRSISLVVANESPREKSSKMQRSRNECAEDGSSDQGNK